MMIIRKERGSWLVLSSLITKGGKITGAGWEPQTSNALQIQPELADLVAHQLNLMTRRHAPDAKVEVLRVGM